MARPVRKGVRLPALVSLRQRIRSLGRAPAKMEIRADGMARIVDAADGREIARVEQGGPVTAVVFSPDGDRLATASGDGTVSIVDARAGR